MIISTAIGAIINFILNLWLIPSLSQDGAAIATLVAEFFVTITMFILGRNHLFLKWNKSGRKELLGLTRRRKREQDLFKMIV